MYCLLGQYITTLVCGGGGNVVEGRGGGKGGREEVCRGKRGRCTVEPTNADTFGSGVLIAGVK